MTIHDVKDDPILQVSSQEPSVSSKYDFEKGGGSWGTVYSLNEQLYFKSTIYNL